MKKKHKYILILILILPILIWVSTLLYCNTITSLYGNEFEDFNHLGFDDLSTYDWHPKFKVLYYSLDMAKVYYFDEDLGQKVVFLKKGDAWEYSDTLLIWSASGGSASDYFVWPYFKHFVI